MSFFSKRSIAAAAAVGIGVATMAGLGAVPASAGAPSLHVIHTFPDNYVAPLQFAVQGHHKIYVADSAQSALFRVGSSTPIATGPAPSSNPEASGDLAGVAATRDAIAYTTTSADHQDTRLNILSHGHTKVVSLSDFERKYNPDKRNYYGLEHPSTVSSACKAELTAGQVPISYRGQYDSHPYAVTSLGHGSWAVADAGGNDVVKVDRWGHVSLIAVLPAQPTRITQAMADDSHAPDCVGVVYRFEPVPTDVEVGPWHKLYVTTLPGGPEDPAFGGRGSVYKLDGHHPYRIATGFNEATNLAISPRGTIYVAELGSGTISVVRHGHGHVVATLPAVAGVEWANGHLYASTAPAVTGGKDPGKIVVLG